MTGPRRLAILLIAVVVAVAVGAAVKLGGGPESVVPSGTPGVAGVGLQPRVAPGPAGADAALIAGIPKIRLARVVIDSRVSGSAGGPPLAIPNGDPIMVSAGMQLAVFEGPVSVGGDLWFQVSPLSNPNTGPADYLAWLPLHDAQRAETIAFLDPPVCPGGEGISVLAALDPFTRAGCIGATSLTMKGWTGDRLLPTSYAIRPAWLGEQNAPVDSTISVHDAGPRPGGAALDLQVPPGLERPPFEIEIEVTAHVADPASGSCVRSNDQTLVPPDDPRFGHIWCATRLVIEQWTPLLGPEERPIDPAAPQLHRHPAGNGVCAGVGMAMLVFHMDPTQLDPVWLEAIGGNGSRIIPSFAPSFRAVSAPDLEIVDASGQVVATDGTVVNPDGRLSGHFICPTGQAVFFD